VVTRRKIQKILFLTDAPPCSLKTGRVPTKCYPKMLRLICVANGFHSVADTVRLQISLVDSLIAKAKKVFLKAPTV